MKNIWAWVEYTFSGHFTIGRLTVYGFNAMHVALNYRTKRWGWICFHPPMKCFGRWWPWKFYISRSATPWEATYAIGPGVTDSEKAKARERRAWPLCQKCRAHVDAPGELFCWRHGAEHES